MESNSSNLEAATETKTKQDQNELNTHDASSPKVLEESIASSNEPNEPVQKQMTDTKSCLYPSTLSAVANEKLVMYLPCSIDGHYDLPQLPSPKLKEGGLERRASVPITQFDQASNSTLDNRDEQKSKDRSFSRNILFSDICLKCENPNVVETHDHQAIALMVCTLVLFLPIGLFSFVYWSRTKISRCENCGTPRSTQTRRPLFICFGCAVAACVAITITLVIYFTHPSAIPQLRRTYNIN